MTQNCFNCSSVINPDAKFCESCGYDLSNLRWTNSNSEPAETVASDDNPASFISPAGAAFAVICFFLPWIQQSCGERTTISTGADLGGIYWLVPLMGVTACGVYFLCKYRRVLYKARKFIIACAVVALGFHGFIFNLFINNDSAEFKSGFFGSMIGFFLAVAGCAFMSRPERTGTDNSKDFN